MIMRTVAANMAGSVHWETRNAGRCILRIFAFSKTMRTSIGVGTCGLTRLPMWISEFDASAGENPNVFARGVAES
jgi:hypothetical protein